MNKTFVSIILALLMGGSVFGGLTLIQPNGGELLLWGSTYQIRWSAPPAEGEQWVHIYLGEKLIADTSKKKDGSFSWKVGKLKNGVMVPPGQYKIVLESLDGDAFGGTFTILKLVKIFPGIKVLNFYKKPGDCPQCFQIDLKQLNKKIKSNLKQLNRKPHKIQLYCDGHKLAELGKAGGLQRLKDANRITLPGNLQQKLAKMKLQPKKQLDGILKLINEKGKVVETHKVKLIFQLPTKPPRPKPPNIKKDRPHR